MASLAPADEFLAEHADRRLVGRGPSRAVAFADQLERGRFGVGDQAVAIHGDEIAGAEEAEAARLFGAGGNLGHGQGLEERLQSVEQVEVLAARGVFVGANEHFLRAAAGRDQADAGFDQADVGFGGGLDARAVQADFAAAAERQALRRDDDRARRVLEREIGVLEVAHGEVQVVPFLLLRGDQEQQEIGAGGKIHGLVGDDHGVEILGAGASRRPGAWPSMSSPMAFILA